MTRADGVAFTAVTQTVPAGPLGNAVVSLRAWVRTDGIDAAGALMLMATGADRKMVAYAQSDAANGAGSDGWQQHEVRLLLPAAAQQLMLGLRQAGGGVRWFDDVEAAAWAVDAADAKPLSSAAGKYLDEAVQTIREQALNSARVDWKAAAAESRALAAGAGTGADTYPAIRHVLKQLGDGHSHLITPGEKAAADRSAVQSIANVALSAVHGRPMLAVPGFANMDSAAGQQFASKIQQMLAQAGRPECGLLLDLRNNRGGSMFPMLAGLAPLFADGEVGGLATAQQGRVVWRYHGNTFITGGSGVPETRDRAEAAIARIGNGRTPVAVLLGPATGSSGEAVAIAFVGRPNARSFGTPSAGLTTGNRPLKLSDGAILAITGSVMLDRNGKQYGGKITPDEVIAVKPSNASVDDPVVGAALDWLERQNACPRQ